MHVHYVELYNDSHFVFNKVVKLQSSKWQTWNILDKWYVYVHVYLFSGYLSQRSVHVDL